MVKNSSQPTTPATPLQEILQAFPASEPVFRNLGIDCEQAADETLADVCNELKLDLQTVLRVLAAGQVPDPPVVSGPIELMSLSQLCDHLQAVHHAALQTELNRLDLLLTRIGDEEPKPSAQLQAVRERFEAFREKLAAHLREEAEVLFPLIRQLDDPRIADTGVLDLLRQPLSRMKHEHGEVDEALATLEATAGVQDPVFRKFSDGLQHLQDILHGQIYQENQILFRRVLALVEGR